MINAALEPLNCTVLVILNGSENNFLTRVLQIIFFIFIPRDFSSGLVCLFLFSRLYISCAPFLFFYIYLD